VASYSAQKISALIGSVNTIDEDRHCHDVIYVYMKTEFRDQQNAAQWEELYRKDGHEFKLKCNTLTTTWQAGHLI
jgi:hypothetical protein